jgi:hypothetical protein
MASRFHPVRPSPEKCVVNYCGISQKLSPTIAHLGKRIVDPDSNVALSQPEPKPIEQSPNGRVALWQTISPDLNRLRFI